jgi:hypothetical protein
MRHNCGGGLAKAPSIVPRSLQRTERYLPQDQLALPILDEVQVVLAPQTQPLRNNFLCTVNWSNKNSSLDNGTEVFLLFTSDLHLWSVFLLRPICL